MFVNCLHLSKIWALIGLMLIASVTTASADSVSGSIPAGSYPLAVAVNLVTFGASLQRS